MGAGLPAYSVWGYCIAKNRSGVVELNPRLLAFILGTTEKEVEAGIRKLTKEDPESRSKDEMGKRLIKEGEYQYRMVNWATYDGLKSASDLREYNRRKQQERRDRLRQAKGKPLPGETAYVKGVENGTLDMDGKPVKEGLEEAAAEVEEPVKISNFRGAP